MIVLYLKKSNEFLQAIPGNPEIYEDKNKLYFADGQVIINDLKKAGYFYAEDKRIAPKYDSEGNELPQMIDELGLVQLAERPKDEITELKERMGEMEKVKSVLINKAVIKEADLKVAEEIIKR